MIYRFKFVPSVSLEEAEMTIQLSLIAAEGLHGEARVRLDAAYYLNEKERQITVDARTPIGQDVAAIYCGFCLREFGRDAFDISRREKVSTPADAGTEGK